MVTQSEQQWVRPGSLLNEVLLYSRTARVCVCVCMCVLWCETDRHSLREREFVFFRMCFLSFPRQTHNVSSN